MRNYVNHQHSTTHQDNIPHQDAAIHQHSTPHQDHVIHQHKTYLKTEERIGQSLALALQNRFIDYPVTILCQNAGISPVTFYYHYASANQALLGYEQGIKTDFLTHRPISGGLASEMSFVLHFLSRRSSYFKALFRAHSRFLLHDLLLNLHSLQPQKLIAGSLSKELYLAQLETILIYWTLIENCSLSKFSKYLTYLCKTKLVRIE